MEIAGYEIPGVLVAAAVVGLVGVALSLWDLARHDVAHLPKWAWALIIVLINFPLGAIIYFVVGRTQSEGQTHGDAVPTSTTGKLTASRTRVADPVRVGDMTADAIDWADAVLTTRGLTKRYGTTTALDDVDLTVPRGRTYGLIGPNGAGKTTLLSILAGLRRPTQGSVELGVDRHRVGVLVDTPQFEPWLTAWEVVDLARHLTSPHLPADRVHAVLTEVGLEPAMHRRVGGFSRGMLQRLGLAGCLVGDPELLLLDEPSSALDPAGRREVLELIGRLAHTKTVLLSTHILSDVQQVADHVGVIDEGRLRYQGRLEDLLTRTSTVYALHVRPPSDGFLEELRRTAWIDDVDEQAPGRLRIVVSDAPRAEREIPRLLAEHKQHLVAFNPATDLETAFLELTT